MSNENLGKQWIAEIIGDIKKRRDNMQKHLARLKNEGHYKQAHVDALALLNAMLSAAAPQVVADERAKLYAVAIKAAEDWVSAEYLSTRSIGRGGPDLSEGVSKAEVRARNAISALAAAPVQDSVIAADNMEACDLQKLLLEEFACYRMPHPAGLMAWATSALLDCSPHRNAPVQAQEPSPELTVWYGAMPESNGKSNFTATLKRKDARPFDTNSYTFQRSEYPERVRYEADCMRYLIGEIDTKPDILAYDADKHSGYIAPVQPVAVPDGWRDAALAIVNDLRIWMSDKPAGPKQSVESLAAYIAAPAEQGDALTEREKFEKHFGPKDNFCWRNADDTYKNASTQQAWAVWQAAIAAKAVQP